jgi:hypothetical protein
MDGGRFMVEASKYGVGGRERLGDGMKCRGKKRWVLGLAFIR